MNYELLRKRAYDAFLESFKQSNGAYKNLSWLAKNKDYKNKPIGKEQ